LNIVICDPLCNRTESTRCSIKKKPLSFRLLTFVCLSSVTRVYCDKTTPNRITPFSLQSSVSTVSKLSLKTKFEGGFLDERVNLCWGGLRLGRTTDIACYIRLHMTSHYFRTARASRSCTCRCNKHAKYSRPLHCPVQYSNIGLTQQLPP